MVVIGGNCVIVSIRNFPLLYCVVCIKNTIFCNYRQFPSIIQTSCLTYMAK